MEEKLKLMPQQFLHIQFSIYLADMTRAIFRFSSSATTR
jgi:hypothetical protein